MHLPVGGGPPSVGPPDGVLDADALHSWSHGLLRQVNDMCTQQIVPFAGSSRNGGETNRRTTTPSKNLPRASTVRLSVIFQWYLLSYYHLIIPCLS